jgi:hypothetical protein
MPGDSIRQRALRGLPPDRSKDSQPPTDRSLTEQCACGAKMVGRIDKSNQHQGWLRWYWWCGGCGAMKDGGIWHPQTEEELVWERWKKAQEGV